MNQDICHRAVMFADIAGSTRLYEQLGDTSARQIIAQTIELMTKLIIEQQGVVIKTIGDEVMCAFETADQAAASALNMQDQIPKQDSEVPVQLRIGMHYGDVIQKDADLFGDTVNVAARMTTIANATQVITTEETMQQLSPQWSLYGRAYDRTHVKGKQQAINIYELTADTGDQTVMMDPSFLNDSVDSQQLTLNYLGKEYPVSSGQIEFLLGRDTQNDLVISSPRVSRIHGKISFQRGKFVYSDNSTNGSYIQTSGEEAIYLRREQGILTGIGQICIGHECDEATDETIISYHVSD